MRAPTDTSSRHQPVKASQRQIRDQKKRIGLKKLMQNRQKHRSALHQHAGCHQHGCCHQHACCHCMQQTTHVNQMLDTMFCASWMCPILHRNTEYMQCTMLCFNSSVTAQTLDHCSQQRTFTLCPVDPWLLMVEYWCYLV